MAACVGLCNSLWKSLPSHCVLKMAAPLLAGGGTGEMGVSKNVCYKGRLYEKNGAKDKRNLRHPPPPFPSHIPDLQHVYDHWSKPLIRYCNYGITTQFQALDSSWRVLKILYEVRVLDWWPTPTLEDQILFRGFVPWGAGVTKPRELTLPPRFETCFWFLSWALSLLAVRASSSPELRKSTQTSQPT